METTRKLAEFRLSGGFAGFCDYLIVYTDGSASYSSECSGKKADFRVEDEEFTRLKAFAAELGRVSYKSEDNPGGPDNLATDLNLYGQGSAAGQPKDEQTAALLKLMNTILQQGKSGLRRTA